MRKEKGGIGEENRRVNILSYESNSECFILLFDVVLSAKHYLTVLVVIPRLYGGVDAGQVCGFIMLDRVQMLEAELLQ